MVFLRLINRINEWVGRIFSLTLILIMLFAFYEVVRRYVFSSPTLWVWEINSQLLCLMGALAGGYTMLNKAHVSVDIVTGRLSERTRAIVDILTAPIFFLLVGSLVYFGGKEALAAFHNNQRVISQLGTPLWPIKTVIPIGAALLFLQGLAKLVDDIHLVLGHKGN